ncbi:glycoside hydrolase [Schizothecium vesticola]|uniref:Glycoside hydrolase n=1 Tax=Schizothecium vesticola TaxID=314040 RepID=A0AA40K9G8_9PEZI|nr:glycoside hydrolase [Schizothecium vesticola]
MLSLPWNGLFARVAVLLPFSPPAARFDYNSYSSNTLDALKALQHWYDGPTGLWNSTSWWNGANCLTVLADWATLNESGPSTLRVADILSNTFSKAQLTTAVTQKTVDPDGFITSGYTCLGSQSPGSQVSTRGFPGFINDFYDDEGWWALAWIRSWDVTQNPAYLATAQDIFDDMHNGTDSVCGGGIWWSKKRDYKNAIPNELYLSVAASLANRVADSQRADYLALARRSWAWFQQSGMINDDHLVNDGLVVGPNGSCVNNGRPTWSYNQGVLLGGLVELARATGNDSYLDQATDIATAAIAMLSDRDGVFREATGCEPNCGGDGSQFKGIFVRNLRYLHKAAPRDEFRDAILRNAESIWAKNRDEEDRLGIQWVGPASAGLGPNASTHSSALDVLVAAMAVVEY